jgi:hypothetical protein
MIPTAHSASRPTRRRRPRIIALVAAAAVAITACGGADGDDSSAIDSGALLDDASDGADLDGDTSGLDTSGLDDGQLDILDDVVDGLEDEFGDDDGDAAPTWNGIRLIDGWGNGRLDVIDDDSFSGIIEVFSTAIPDGRNNTDDGFRLLDSSVVAGGDLWISAKTGVHRVSLVDGSITATVTIDEVLPGGEFGDIAGDDAGVYVIAFVTGGSDVIAQIDPTDGSLRGTIDLSNEFTSLYALASNGTHVAAAYKDAPGIPVKLIDRATGSVNDIGDYLDFVDVHIVRDQLWVVSETGGVSDPNTYEVFDLEGTPISSGTLPRPGKVRTFGDRLVLLETSNAADPSAPVAPIEIEPQGTPIETFLPAGMVTLTGYAEIDGFAISHGSCCVVDRDGFGVNGAVIDMSTGEIVRTLDGTASSIILPPA